MAVPYNSPRSEHRFTVVKKNLSQMSEEQGVIELKLPILLQHVWKSCPQTGCHEYFLN